MVSWKAALALLGLLGAVTCTPQDDVCPDGITVVELQPYEIVGNKPGNSVVTGTRTVTKVMQHDNTGAPVPPCLGCKTITTTVPTPFCKTIPPVTQGGVPTVITGVMPPCHNCATIITTGPEPYITTLPPHSADTIPTVIICKGPPGDPEAVISHVPGPREGVLTILPEPGCDCGATFVITTVPSSPPTGKIVTTSVPGTVPGTTTIPPTPGCSEDCITTVRVTSVPPSPPTGKIVTTSVPGTVPGTTTIPPTPGCSEDCITTIRVTSVPPSPPSSIVTTSVPGTVPGTTTIPPTPGCSEDCITTIRVTSVPPSPPSSIITTSIPGTVPGTTTIPPATDCSEDCTSTTVPSEEPTTSTSKGLTISTTSTSNTDTISTTSPPETVPGTTTIPPATDCSEDCTSTTVLSKEPTTSTSKGLTTSTTSTSNTDTISTTSPLETVPGITTIPPATDCSEDCTSTTAVPSEEPSTTQEESTTTSEGLTTSTTSTSNTDTTSTTTVASTTSQCARPTCSTGITRARYPDPFNGEAGFNERFNTTYYKENTPESQETVDDFSDIGDANGSFLSYEYATFVYSCEGGSFSFQINSADDIALAWFGDTACGDFEKDNNQTFASYEGGPGDVTFTTTLEPGQYFPIRLIYANAGGPASLNATVTGPNGTVADSLFYPVPCDNSNAFTPFGTEATEGKTCNNP
ncbi:FLO9-like protein [Fusarium circinatum]|uniref:FLO9-like protein n=1 Tax=Fusarium circinatum TaxID=48490 RepID=A0A8H5SYJ5_FUSCI|nr:FLO9-like protein [Fusarium circinatum]